MKTLILSTYCVTICSFISASMLLSSDQRQAFDLPRQPIAPAHTSVTTAITSTEESQGLYPSHELPQQPPHEIQQPYRHGQYWEPGRGIPTQHPYYVPPASQPVPCQQPAAYPGYTHYPVSGSPLSPHYGLPQSAPAQQYRINSETPPTPDSGVDQKGPMAKSHRRTRSGSMPDLVRVSVSDQSLADGTDTDTEVELVTKKYVNASGDRVLEILHENRSACLAALEELKKIITTEVDMKIALWEDANKKARATSPTSRSSFSRVFGAAAKLVTSKEQQATKAQKQKLKHFDHEMGPTREKVLHTAGLLEVISNNAQKYQTKLSEDPAAIEKQ